MTPFMRGIPVPGWLGRLILDCGSGGYMQALCMFNRRGVL
jgi:hypothetical protein